MKYLIILFLISVSTSFIYGQQHQIEIQVEGLDKNDSLRLADLSLSYNVRLEQKINLKSIFFQKSRNVFIINFKSLKDGRYSIVLNTNKFKPKNHIWFIRNENTLKMGLIKKTLLVEKNTDVVNNKNDEISWSVVTTEALPYLIINSKRKEWGCYIKENFDKTILDSLITQKITFDIEWNNEGKVVNMIFINQPKNKKVKSEFERIIYSSPHWVLPKNDNRVMDTYELTFDNSKIFYCR